MNKHYYYKRGNYHICYNTKGLFECKNKKSDKIIHKLVNDGIWLTGDFVVKNEEIRRIKIDNYTTESVKKITTTKVHKGMKATCPLCYGQIVFKGWRVWVENIKDREIIFSMLQTGTKILYTKYCKTLKNRKETINRLLNKYKIK